MTATFGGGGTNGARIFWPAGLEAMTPAERAAALARGYWLSEGNIMHRDGWKAPYTASMRKAYPL